MHYQKYINILKLIKILPLVFLVLSSCDIIDFKAEEGGINFNDNANIKPIARAHDQYLYFNDLEGLIPPDISKADSANLIQRYVKSWINKQLVISEASEQLNLDEVEIERKVLDYRYALMIHEYQKLYINEKLEGDVSPGEVEAYYVENKDNFQLRQNIIKCRYVKLAKEAPRINVFKRLFISNNDKQLEELRSYCYQYSTTFHLDTTWVNFDEVIENTPMVTIDNKIQFLRRTSYYETSDDNYLYFLKIMEYKISDEISPLEWVFDDIVRIIINKRKVELAKELEEGIYERAVQNSDFEIFSN
jgi:DNA-binding transcriptional regulator GbsR (MarR family)